MKKRTYIVLLLLLSLFISGCTQKTKDVVASGKVVSYESLAEMEKQADLIVTGKKLEGDLYISKGESGQVYASYSTFSVDEIFKDSSGTVTKGQILLIQEMDILDQKEGIRYHVNNYGAMNRKDTYILFLKYSPYASHPYYYIMGVNFGICNLTGDYRMRDYSGRDESNEVVNRWREEILSKYHNAGR